MVMAPEGHSVWKSWLWPLNCTVASRGQTGDVLGEDLSLRATLGAPGFTPTRSLLSPDLFSWISELSLNADVTRTGKVKLAQARKDQVRLKCQSILQGQWALLWCPLVVMS